MSEDQIIYGCKQPTYLSIICGELIYEAARGPSVLPFLDDTIPFLRHRLFCFGEDLLHLG